MEPRVNIKKMPIFTYKNLYRAYLECRKNKRKTINALKFEMNLEENLFQLLQELKTRTYIPGRSICFVVTIPVPREIFAADFRDRVVHHLLIREILPYAERQFIFDSYACRKNKGTLKAVKRLKKFIHKINSGNVKDVYYAQMDIKSFFMSIDQKMLFAIFRKLAGKINDKDAEWKEQLLWLAKVFIFHQPQLNYKIKGMRALFSLIPSEKSLLKQPVGKGLPIGNHTSQFFANLYLNQLDQFVKRELKRKFYARYVDDFVILGSREELKEIPELINQFLRQKLFLKLNTKKTKMQPISRGISFLGYFIKPSHILVKNNVVKRFKNKLYALNENFSNKIDHKKIQATVNSYLGHFKHSKSFNLRKDIFDNHLEKLADLFKPGKDFLKAVLNYPISPVVCKK